MQQTNWTAIIMTSLTVFVGLGCAVLALTLAKDNAAWAGMLFTAAGASLGSFLRQPQSVGRSDAEPRDKQAGHAAPSVLFTALLCALVCLFVWILAPKRARADTPISKCWSTVCAEPQVSVSLLQYNLTDKKIGAGILPVGSVGYGLRLPNDYFAAGIFLSTKLVGDGPNFIAPAILFRVMRAFTFGPALYLGEDRTKWLLEFGGGFGL